MTDAQALLEKVVKMNNPLTVQSWMEYHFKTHGLADMVKSSRMLTV